jgi:hypothetical protein
MLSELAVSGIYSEMLSRIVDRPGLQHQIKSGLTIEQIAINVASSQEFNSHHLNNTAIAESLYRALLRRDADPSGLMTQVDYLNRTGNVSGLIRNIAASPEFQSVNFDEKFDKFGIKAFAFNKIRQVDLEDQLKNHRGDFKLPPQTLIEIERTLKIPSGVRILTDTSSRHYLNYARFERVNGFDAPMVSLEPGAQIEKIWFDGNTNAFKISRSGENLRVEPGGYTSEVKYNRFDSPNGYTNIWVVGDNGYGNVNGAKSGYTEIAHNFIVGDATTYLTDVADGISNGGNYTEIYGNQILNSTDIGIISFAMSTRSESVPNQSKVYNNLIVNIGINASAALSMDGYFNFEKTRPGDPSGVASKSFEGFQMYNNEVWTGETGRYNVVLAVGTRLWSGNDTYTSTGGEIFNNYSPTDTSINAFYGTIASGALDVSVYNNQFEYRNVMIEHGADFDRGFASGYFGDEQYLDKNYDAMLTAFNIFSSK